MLVKPAFRHKQGEETIEHDPIGEPAHRVQAKPPWIIDDTVPQPSGTNFRAWLKENRGLVFYGIALLIMLFAAFTMGSTK